MQPYVRKFNESALSIAPLVKLIHQGDVEGIFNLYPTFKELKSVVASNKDLFDEYKIFPSSLWNYQSTVENDTHPFALQFQQGDNRSIAFYFSLPKYVGGMGTTFFWNSGKKQTSEAADYLIYINTKSGLKPDPTKQFRTNKPTDIVGEFIEMYTKRSKDKMSEDGFTNFLEERYKQYGSEYAAKLTAASHTIQKVISKKDKIDFDRGFITLEIFNQAAFEYFEGDTNYSMTDTWDITPDGIRFFNWIEKN